MEKVTDQFLNKIGKGDRIFKFPQQAKGKGEDYVLYAVLKKINGSKVELINVFDEKEKRKEMSLEDMLTEGCWYYNPSFERRGATGAN
jgi:hypothetical protein